MATPIKINMMKNKIFRFSKIYSLMLIGLFFIASCAKQRSTKTGWEMNNPNHCGFEEFPAMDQETGPGLILVEGGTFTMGRIEQDVTLENHNIPRRVTVSSFYIDETEITLSLIHI